MSISTLVRRVLILGLAVLALGVAATDARAFNPANQTTVTGMVNNQYWDLDAFWKANFNAWSWRNYRSPYVRYFNNGPYNNFQTNGCGSTSSPAFMNDMGVYCGPDNAIYVNYTNEQLLIDKDGDGAGAFLFAHEFGHHIQGLEGRLGAPSKQKELNADCLAGMYFRWGVAVSRLLNANDYVEAQWGIVHYFSSADVAGHGTGADRLAWFRYGYTAYNINSCNLTFSGAVAAKATTQAPLKKRPAARTVAKPGLRTAAPPVG
jgi:predicted metalloprotease